MSLVRYDIISIRTDIYRLSYWKHFRALIASHAGDITSLEDLQNPSGNRSRTDVFGNNDFAYDYGPMVRKRYFSMQTDSNGRFAIIVSAWTL